MFNRTGTCLKLPCKTTMTFLSAQGGVPNDDGLGSRKNGSSKSTSRCRSSGQ